MNPFRFLHRSEVRILAVILPIHLIIVSNILTAEIPWIAPLHHDIIHRGGKAYDFFAVYHAAVNMRSGESPYANNDDGITPDWFPFRYLPGTAAIAVVLTVVSPYTAYAVWVVVLEMLLGVLIWQLWSVIRERSKRAWVTVFLLLSSPYFLEIYMGQFTFAAVALCVIAVLRPTTNWALVLSVLTKPLTAVVFPAFLRRPGRTRQWTYALGALLLGSVPFFLLHSADWSTFVARNVTNATGLDGGNVGMGRLLYLLVGGSISRTLLVQILAAIRVVVLGGTVLVVLFARRESVSLGAAALLLAHFISYQHVWEHHLSAVIVVGCMLYGWEDLSRTLERATLAALIVLALPTLFVVFFPHADSSVWDPSTGWTLAQSLALVIPSILAMLWLYGVAIYLLLRDGFGVIPLLLRIPRPAA